MDNYQDAAGFTASLYGSDVIAKNANVVQDIYDGNNTFKDMWTEPIAMWKQLTDSGYLSADMFGSTSDEAITAFTTGQVVMIIAGSWNLNTIASINPELNYECMAVPETEERCYCGVLNVSFCINSASENTELAKEFFEFTVFLESLEAQYQGCGGFMVAECYIPELPAEIVDAVESGKEGKYYIPMVYWLSYTESLRLIYVRRFQDCMAGTSTSEETVTRMDKKLEEVFSE